MELFFREETTMNKTSARNFYCGKVTSIKKGAVNADVKIVTTAGIDLAAIITNESLSRLKLKKGKEASAFFKASSVILTVDKMLTFSTRNVFWGKIVKVKRGAVNSEVLLQITPKVEIVATITNESVKNLKLKKGVVAGALVKASQLILAV